ncbi:MAG: glycosyltransferase family 2 protein [Gemmataceae bacterium]
MEKAPLSVILPTFNEEANLQMALDSVKGWASEIFVVDSYSSDRTVDIALSQPEDNVRVVQHRFAGYAAQWNWAISHLPITQPWILLMAADERATDAFAAEVRQRITDPRTEESGFLVNSRFIFMGKWLRWGGMSSNPQTRIWRTGKGRLEEREVNEHLIVDGKLGRILSPIEHHDYKDLGFWIEKHNRYSALEARALLKGDVTGEVSPRLFGQPEERRMWLRKWYYRVPGRPLWYFLYRYFLRLGLLDGLNGFRFAFLHASYFYWIDLKQAEYRATGELPVVLWLPRGAPHPLVANSELQRQVDAMDLIPALEQTR